MSLFEGMSIKSSDQKGKGRNSTPNKVNEIKEIKLQKNNELLYGNNLRIKKVCTNIFEEKSEDILNYRENEKRHEKYNNLYELKKNNSIYDFETLSDCSIYENINNKIDETDIYKNVNGNEKKINNNEMTQRYDNLNEIKSNNFNYIKNNDNNYNYLEKKYCENMNNNVGKQDENNYLIDIQNNYSLVVKKDTKDEYFFLKETNIQNKEQLYNYKDQLNYFLNIVLNIFNDMKNVNFNFLKNIFQKLYEDNVNENILIILYFYIYHSYICKQIYNLKAEYNYDKLIYKLLLNIHNIRKKRKRDKEKEKILIINEKLDVADIIQNKILNYNTMLMKIEDYIIHLFKKKKNIYNNSLLLKIYVCNMFKIIIRNIYLKKKKENKNQKEYIEKKRKELHDEELKILEKEKKINDEEQNIIKKKEKIEEENENVNKCINDVSLKYDEQLNTLKDKICTIDDDIKELEKKIELKKIEKMEALKKRDNLENDKNKELNILLLRKSEINANFNFLNNSICNINEKKKQVDEGKEKMKNMSHHLKTIYENFYKKKVFTNVLIIKLQKIIQILYENNYIEDDKNSFINIFTNENTNPQLNEVNIKDFEEENNINYENEIKKKIEMENLNDIISDINNVSEKNFLYSSSKEESENIKNDNIMKNNKIEKKNNINEFTIRKYMSTYNLSISNSLKQIFFLKKKRLKLEKNINFIKEKKKKLMIDINQHNCEIDNINIRKENLKNKKKILLKSKMLNEIKNTINELNELLETESVFFNQLENFKVDMNNMDKKYIILKEQKEKIKEKLFILEKKLLKSEITNAKFYLSKINKINSQKLNDKDLTNECNEYKKNGGKNENIEKEKIESEQIKKKDEQKMIEQKMIEQNIMEEEQKEKKKEENIENKKEENIEEKEENIEKKKDITGESEKEKEEIKDQEDFVFSEDSEENILKINFSKIIDELKDISSLKEYDESYNDNKIKNDVSESSFHCNFEDSYKKKKTFIKLDKNESNENEKNRNENNEIENSEIENNEIENNEVEKSEIENSEVENSEVENSEIEKSEIENSEVENSEVENSEIEMSEIEKSEIEKSEIENSEIENSEIENSEIENNKIENNEIISSEVENKKIEKNESEISILIKESRKNKLKENSHKIFNINENKDIIQNEEFNIKNNELHGNNYYKELFNTLKRLNKEENETFENILYKYKTFYVLNEDIDYNILEKEIQNFYSNMVEEERILKMKRLTILNKKKNALKKYYYYASDNSEDDELNV
ncbi:conserved Plasmodium protein, unknown function [Plasmodium gallinaceum]|uniref:Uncharacterized protein n=1 Tax=Plasmodium gallinaceum TaxID=5849 RepID=A0A1J1GZZ9_PLAGA|nr:conserved Plasmodium protein, unknown function [Plasmodium gallinaceum]CRG98152.1 conserved Plasmodium protein, unknown function [Plasmodium gallinaceum]